MFGIGPVSDLVIILLSEKPGMLSPKIMLKALVDDNCIDIVFDLAKKWKERFMPLDKDGRPLGSSAVLCASACWALGFFEYREDILNFLYSILEADKCTIAEKLMASEALLKIGHLSPEMNRMLIDL